MNPMCEHIHNITENAAGCEDDDLELLEPTRAPQCSPHMGDILL